MALSLASIAINSDSDAATERADLGSLAELSGQIAEQAAKLSGRSLDMLGITSPSCNCPFTSDGKEGLWLFHAEPKIKGIDRDGPSHDKMKQGDVLVAIDGMLITTRKAGVRFANLDAGEPVELTVRRRFGTRSVTIVLRAAREPEESTEFTMNRFGKTDTLTLKTQKMGFSELARSIEELSKRAVDIGEVIDTMGVPPQPGSTSFRELNIGFGESIPRGWIGFGLLFEGGIRQKESDEPAEWRFETPPLIRSVQAGSPVDQAGLQASDVVVENDGLKLPRRRRGDRFSRMEPRQVVEWEVRRGEKTCMVKTKAGEHP